MESPTKFSQAPPPPMGFFTLEPLSSVAYFFFSIRPLQTIKSKFTFGGPPPPPLEKRSQIAGFEL